MKKLLTILLCSSISYFVSAQQITKQKELGVIFNDLNNFGLTFKSGTMNSLWRFNTLLISGSNRSETSDSLTNKFKNKGIGLKFGKEFRKNIIEDLDFRYGGDVSFSYKQTTSDMNDKTINDDDRYQKSTTYEPGINLILGINYSINENVILGAEVLPGISYITGDIVEKVFYLNNGEEQKSKISGFNYGFSNTSALLTIAYKF